MENDIIDDVTHTYLELYKEYAVIELTKGNDFLLYSEWKEQEKL